MPKQFQILPEEKTEVVRISEIMGIKRDEIADDIPSLTAGLEGKVRVTEFFFD
jgi:hypothetical protein